MTLIVNGLSRGEFIVTRNNGGGTAEPGFWHAAAQVNATEPLPLDRLNELGRVKIVWAEQSVFFYPHHSPPQRSRLKPEVNIEPVTRTLDIKSIDYNLTHHSQAGQAVVGNVTATGRAGQFDLDLRAGIGVSEDYFSGQWHNEEGRWVTDIELGRVQRHGLDGLSLTNEPSLAGSMFTADQIELYWPAGTRVDVYRDGQYVESLILDSDPYQYEVELTYSNNSWSFHAIMPDGRTDSREIERSISGRLAPVGKMSYRIAGGEDRSGTSRIIGSVGYGLTRSLSLFAGHDDRDRSYASALYARDNLSLEPTWYGDDGWAVSGAWQNSQMAIHGRAGQVDGVRNRTFSLSYRNVFKPTLRYTQRLHNRYEVIETTLRTHHSVRVPQLKTSLSLSPHYTQRSRNGIDGSAHGVRLLASIQGGWQAVSTWEREALAGRDIQRLQAELSRRFKLGRVTYRNNLINFGRGWASQNQSVRVDLWNWDTATLSVMGNRSWSGENSISVSISGSLGRSGLKRMPQRNQATLILSACRDLNHDGICQESEPEATGVAASIAGRQVVTPAVIDSLTPYRQYLVELGHGFDLSPRYRAIETGRLIRGGVNHMRLPLSEVVEIEGELERDGIRVALIDENTGDVISEQVTQFGGWYLFYAPAHQQVKVQALDG